MRHSAFVILPGFGLTSLVIGLIIRMIVSFFAVWGTGFNLTNASICVSYTFRFRFDLSSYRIVLSLILSFSAVLGTGLNLTNAPSAFVILSGLGLTSLVIGLIIRMIVSFVAVWGTGFNWKERFFIPVAWLPKATVQV